MINKKDNSIKQELRKQVQIEQWLRFWMQRPEFLEKNQRDANFEKLHIALDHASVDNLKTIEFVDEAGGFSTVFEIRLFF